jgi:hypothetical protein
MNKQQYESWDQLLALALKVVGLLGIIFITVFWAATDRLETAFLPFFATLAGIGEGIKILSELRRKP